MFLPRLFFRYALCAVALFVLTGTPASAAVIAQYDGLGSGAPTSADANVVASDAVFGAGFNSATSGFGSSSGFFFTRTNGTSGSDPASTVAAEEYLSFQITPNVGYEMDLETFTFKQRATNTPGGAGSSSFNFVADVRSSVDGFASSIMSYVVTSGVNPTPEARTVDLSAAAFQDLAVAIEIRIYFRDNANNAGQVNRITEIALNGEVALIPEPTSFALLGLGGLCLLPHRKRRQTHLM